MAIHYGPVTTRTMCGVSIGPRINVRYDLTEWFQVYTYANSEACEHCTRKMRRWVQFNNRFRVADQIIRNLKREAAG